LSAAGKIHGGVARDASLCDMFAALLERRAERSGLDEVMVACRTEGEG
jgi:hypothetical protein